MLEHFTFMRNLQVLQYKLMKNKNNFIYHYMVFKNRNNLK